jgi:RNA polymerase sigma factor (sigma-70 family)
MCDAALASPLAPFTLNWPVIENVIRFISRRHHLSADDAADFASVVRLRLLDRDCAILRKFKGRSSLRTFLMVVVQRLFHDFQIERKGRWRPSTEARRLGPLAIGLERLYLRDGLTFGEAVATLRSGGDVAVSDDSLWALFGQLPRRARPRIVSGVPPALVDTACVTSDLPLAQRQADSVLAILNAALGRLSPDERRQLRMIFVDGLDIAQTARRCGFEERKFYRRLAALLRRLRHDVERAGLTASDVGAWIGRPDVDTSHTSAL